MKQLNSSSAKSEPWDKSHSIMVTFIYSATLTVNYINLSTIPATSPWFVHKDTIRGAANSFHNLIISQLHTYTRFILSPMALSFLFAPSSLQSILNTKDKCLKCKSDHVTL